MNEQSDSNQVASDAACMPVHFRLRRLTPELLDLFIRGASTGRLRKLPLAKDLKTTLSRERSLRRQQGNDPLEELQLFIHMMDQTESVDAYTGLTSDVKDFEDAARLAVTKPEALRKKGITLTAAELWMAAEFLSEVGDAVESQTVRHVGRARLN